LTRFEERRAVAVSYSSLQPSRGRRPVRTIQSGQQTPCSTVSASTLVYGANNQVTGVIPPGSTQASPTPYNYDPLGSGDIIADMTNGNQYLYDGEGRICAVASSQVPGKLTLTGYLYDAEGNRVAKGTISSWSCDPSANGFTPVNEYVIGPSGEQMTEWGADPNTAAPAWQHSNVWADGQLIATYDVNGWHYYLNDWLGTRRAQTDSSGVLEQSCYGLPFGDGLGCTQSIEFPTEHHFTGKERDQESGNDYFGARYYASSMGRFLSPDWSAKAEPVPYAKLDNPQSLNLYSYVWNNPLSKYDPDGHCGENTGFLANSHAALGLVISSSCSSMATTTQIQKGLDTVFGKGGWKVFYVAERPLLRNDGSNFFYHTYFVFRNDNGSLTSDGVLGDIENGKGTSNNQQVREGDPRNGPKTGSKRNHIYPVLGTPAQVNDLRQGSEYWTHLDCPECGTSYVRGPFGAYNSNTWTYNMMDQDPAGSIFPPKIAGPAPGYRFDPEGDYYPEFH